MTASSMIPALVAHQMVGKTSLRLRTMADLSARPAPAKGSGVEVVQHREDATVVEL
jgi:hypothetical protein